MHPLRKKRLILILLILFGSVLATMLTIFALKQNINLYFTPTQVVNGDAPFNHEFRMGGLVKRRSIQHGTALDTQFILTDTAHEVAINYHGVLPDLFGEGQGVVVEGKLYKNNVFIANQVLAKHGATYMPKPALDAIAKARQQYGS